MNNIDIIFYINLAHRTDRREHFEKEIQKFCKDPSKVIRIEATKHEYGALGCAYSHIEVLKRILDNPNWKNCAIFEDDFTFRNDYEYNNTLLSKFFSQYDKYDVFLMAFNELSYVNETTDQDLFKRVVSAQTTSGYILHRNFVPKLLRIFEFAAAKLLKIYEGAIELSLEKLFNIDQAWKKIQPKNNWYASIPSLGFQMDSYSDISKMNVSYNC